MGADGFIGSHLVERLVAEGAKYDVVATVNLCTATFNGLKLFGRDLDKPP